MDKMDPFTQRMLERARLRREKLEVNLPPSDKIAEPRVPLSENKIIPKAPLTNAKFSPAKQTKSPARDSTASNTKLERKSTLTTPSRVQSIVSDETESGVAVQINIIHQNDVQVEVQVEEREVSLSDYLKEKEDKQRALENESGKSSSKNNGSSASYSLRSAEKESRNLSNETKTEAKTGVKQRLQRLGALYSDEGELSSPIHSRTELAFSSEPPSLTPGRASKGMRGRLAALSSQIHNWEDDITPRDISSKSKKEPTKPPAASAVRSESRKSIGNSSRKSIGRSSPRASVAAQTQLSRNNSKGSQKKSLVDSHTFDKKKVHVENKPCVIGSSPKKQSVAASKWDQSIISDLESKGFKRVSLSQSRLVYDFSSSNHQQGGKSTPASNMAAVAAVSSPSRSPKNLITKKPSIKKYKAPTPPKFKAEAVDCEKENGVCDTENSENIESSVAEIVVSNGKQNGVEKTNNGAPSEGEGSVCSIPEVCRTPRSERSDNSNASSNRSSPISRERINAANSNGSPGGNVLTKAAIFETASPKRNTDPALMSMRDRKALFEKNKGAAIVPKAPFGMAPSIKSLQGNTTNKDVPKKPAVNSFAHPKIEPKPSNIVPTHSPHAGIKSKLGNMFASKIQTTISEKEIVDKVKKEREEEMKMLQNRFHKESVNDLDRIEVENEEDDHSSEESPLMGGNHKSSMTSLALKKPPPVNSPKIIIAPKGKSQKGDACDDDSISEADCVVGQQPPKRRSGSMDSQNVVSVLEDVKRIRVAAPKAGNLYPCLSDIEAPPTDSDNQQSCPASSLNTSSESNQSSQTETDWGNTSFGRDLLKVVGGEKSKDLAKGLSKDCSKGRKALRSKRRSGGNGRNARGDRALNSSSDGANNEDLDDMLDDEEDLDFDGLETESTGPTPPKMNKNGGFGQPSNSFSYKKAAELQHDTKFKSPLKTPPSKGHAPIPDESGKPLMHTVSFYRRQQSQSSQPSTPVRVVKLEGEQEDVHHTKKIDEQKAKVSVNESKRRVKELMDEVAKQNTVISQASQALNLCASTIEFSGSTEQAEGERLLLLASHRRQACLHEMQRVQVEGASPPATSPITLNLQDLCLPLRREYIRQLNADGAVGHYVVCLVKCQEKVVATSLVKTTPELFAVTFPDKIRMEGLDTEFKITVEAYALQASKEILPHDVKYHIATKKSGKLATPRKGVKGADLRSPLVNASPGGPFAVRTPALQPHGYCIFGHHQTQRNSFSLNKACGGGPLEGTLKLKLTVERGARIFVPKNRPPLRGFLTMFEESGGFGAWHRRWCVLSGTDLSYWRYPDDEQKKTPMSTIELCTALTKTIGPAPRDLCARPHTLMLEVRVSGSDSSRVPTLETCAPSKNVRRHLLAADTKLERDSWSKALNEAICDARAQEEASNASN